MLQLPFSAIFNSTDIFLIKKFVKNFMSKILISIIVAIYSSVNFFMNALKYFKFKI